MVEILTYHFTSITYNYPCGKVFFFFFWFVLNIFLCTHQAPTKQLPFRNKQFNLSAAYGNKSPKDKRYIYSAIKDVFIFIL